MKMCQSLLAAIFGLFFLTNAFAQSETRLLRFPAIYGSQLVFSYAGDLYTVSSKGGTARKLTNDAGYEMFSRFSPDGKQIAFTAQYDGNTEVYLMPSEGGIPKRLTYTATLDRDDVSDRMGPNNIVMGWKNGSQIIYRSRKDQWNDFKGDLLLASVDGGLSERLPLPRGGFCSYSPDLKKLAYNRIFREFRTWKRYRGGQADDIWIYDFDSKQTANITNNPAQDIFPMWTGNTIYFISDRDENKRFDLYGYDVENKQTHKYTSFVDFDIKFPSMGNDAIVFENGGYVYRFDLKIRKSEKISIFIADDQAIGRSGWTDVSRQITNYEIASDGSRALFGAHGEIFTVPAKYGNTRNLTNTSGIHERSSKWSPDGKWIAYISDASGENEIYIVPQDGSGPARQLTKGADTYMFALLWSPDSQKILWSDKKLRLKLNAKAEETGSRETVVVPIDDEHALYYFEWVQGNLEKVEKATQGKVGYIHIPDMGVSGLNEFVKYYYPQLRKEALIVDVRGNGGGNVSLMVIERLRREASMIDIARNTTPSFNPGGLMEGPKVCLLDEFSASDGDIFPYRFRYYKLGKLIGKRSWGGVVGIRGTLPIVDGGYLNRPEFSRYDIAGKAWIMEGHGVDPDIVVDNDPAKEFAGIDEQLNRAIEEIQKGMKSEPARIPSPPPYPTK